MLRALRDIDAEQTHYVIPERSGTLDYDATYFQQEIGAANRRNQSQQNFVERYRQRVVGRIQAYFAARGNVRGNEVPSNPALIERLLNSLMPDFTIDLDASAVPPYKITQIEGDRQIGGINQLSSGEAQLLTMALDILTIVGIWEVEGKEVRKLLIDEPDAHIHPDLQVRFADFLVDVADRFSLQVFVATHSPTLLAALGQFGGDQTGVLYVGRERNDLNSVVFDRYMKEASACLGGHALMGPLFGVPMLLVEGDDDYRIWSQVPRHHNVNFAVIPCNGDEIHNYQRTLEKLFASLRNDNVEPAGFALLDGDKPLPQANRDRPQDHIRYCKLNCHEAENLYLADEVLASLECTWEEAAQKLVDEAATAGAKAEFLRGAPGWDRRNIDLKNHMEEISRILDPKNVHWTIRVSQAIGRPERPEGQIADFLGAGVLVAIWGPEEQNDDPAAAD